MNRQVEHFKVAGLLAIIMLAVTLTMCYADTEMESTGNSETDRLLRRDAPVYTGPVQEGDLEELTVDDFEEFGTEPESPQDQYRQYRRLLGQGGAPVPYRMRIVDRDLALEDFLGLGVSEELAEARYNGYLAMIPDTVDGRTVHYVYVYHRPLSPTSAEISLRQG